ncbi:hypothetical protein [Yinghuangia soli]|uniref:Uncharacterized protein n=1 Tax=Yinghuangia soli TaxID=2908204 RepID=A0AA41U8B0_9ACTN|nr:hypothetical protein [Yinghuangia soli]MCF2532724.1 hypothetical protein [Yinghuangia soli]
MTVRSAWLPANQQSRSDTRLAPTGTMSPTGPLTSRPGALPGGTPLLATGVAAMQVRIDPGRAVIQGTALQGAYPVVLSEAETLTVADGDAQYARIDLVVLQVYDHDYDASGQTAGVLRLIKGVAAAGPQVPATPAAALALWSIAVPSKASAGTGGITWASALTDLRVYTVGAGAILPAAGDTAPGAYVGQYRDTGSALERWNGSAWTAYPAPAAPVGVWQPYTPTWRSDGAAPAVGNGSLSGAYTKIGRTVHVRGRLQIGSTTVLGSGAWFFGLPVPAAVGAIAGIIWAFDVGIAINTGAVFIEDNRTEIVAFTSGSAFPWSVSRPQPWAAGDHLNFTLTYESAS